MTFEISYRGDVNTFKVAASTPTRKGDEFYDKMDALTKEYKQLKEEAEGEKEEAINIAEEAVIKALSEKYPDGRYGLSYLDEDGITYTKLEAKWKEMLDFCSKYFEDGEAQIEGGMLDYEGFSGMLNYEVFNSGGRIDVDGEDIDMGDYWEYACEYQECEFSEKREELRKQDWCVSYYVRWMSDWSATIEEDEFDKEKLHWKNSKVHYGDTPIIEQIAGRRCTEKHMEIKVCGDVYEFILAKYGFSPLGFPPLNKSTLE